MRRLGLTPVRPRRGFQRQCGVPLRLWASTLPALLTLRLPLCVVRETDVSLGVVKARRVAEYWQPILPRSPLPAWKGESTEVLMQRHSRVRDGRD